LSIFSFDKNFRRFYHSLFPDNTNWHNYYASHLHYTVLYEGGARNFSKSQGPYRYGSAKSNSFIFWHIPSYFWHNYSFIFRSYLLHQGIPECDVIKGAGRGVGVLANHEITPQVQIWKFFQVPRTFFRMDISPNVTSSGGEGGCTRKS